MTNVFERIMALCTRHPWVVVIASAIITVASGWYVATHFRINTDISGLISKDLPWRQRELAVQKAFPQSIQLILAVVEANTPEQAGAASRAFVAELDKNKDDYRSVQEINGGPFFERNGLLFLPLEQLRSTTEQLKQSTPALEILTADPSIRGLVHAFSLSLAPAIDGIFDDLPQNLNGLARPIEDVLANRPTSFSWRAYLSGKPSSASDLRRLVLVWPKLDFSALQPGLKATTAIRTAAERAKLGDYGAKLRLTGPVPIADEEFATLQKGALLNGVVTAVLVLLILFLALRSIKIVIAVSITLGAGLVVAAALGVLMVGAFNPISVAFAVLFIGLGADFAIQFSVRYRAERNDRGDLRDGLTHAARKVGAPLTLAAAAAAAGFMSFLPTDYVGMAELGLIAGVGMAIAYLAAMVLLPALLQLFDPPPEPEPLGYRFMAPVDHFLGRHRVAVVMITCLIVLGGLPLLPKLRFDFDPLHLRNPNEEAVATYRELSADPTLNFSDRMQVLTTAADAPTVAKKLESLPEVGQVIWLGTFIPPQQDQKLAIVAAAYKAVKPSIRPRNLTDPATDAANIAALKEGAQNLKQVADAQPGPGAIAANRLADDLTKLAEAAPDVRKRAEAALIDPMVWDIDAIPQILQPQTITRDNLPSALVRSYVTPEGVAQVEALPKQPLPNRAARRQAAIAKFANAVLAAEPNASGSAIGSYEWGTTIRGAFIYAAGISLVSIAIILFIVLRRVTDVLLTLIPLIAAAVVTLEICAFMRFPLNYANIIALPVLLGVGVAFKIYYVTAWRAGETEFLQSPLTRAVFFSALMTAVAFGSLSFSSHPGTASMGKLLALSLACTLASAALFQPALMGAAGKGPANKKVTT